MGKFDQHLSASRREVLKAGTGASAWTGRKAKVHAQGLKSSAAKAKQGGKRK